MDLAWFLRDTKICLMAICADFISNIAAVIGVLLLAWRFDGVGGMDKYEVLFMMGYKAVFSEISRLEGVADIELKKAPIEQVIADIYSKWKTGDTP